MPDHTHVLTDNSREIKDVLRYLNGISSSNEGDVVLDPVCGCGMAITVS